jgi:hypothetical protein
LIASNGAPSKGDLGFSARKVLRSWNLVKAAKNADDIRSIFGYKRQGDVV